MFDVYKYHLFMSKYAITRELNLIFTKVTQLRLKAQIYQYADSNEGRSSRTENSKILIFTKITQTEVKGQRNS